MYFMEDGHYSSEASNSSSSSSDGKEGSDSQALAGDLVVVRRLLSTQAKEDEVSQRENIFHTRCLVQGNICSLIIAGGSSTNVGSTRLVNKLNLKTTPHARPYRLQWLTDEGELLFNQ